MPWGAIIATVGGALIGSSASDSAAHAQTAAAGQATAEQAREFNYMQQIYGPQRNLGYGADAMLARLFGMPNPNTSGGMYPANNTGGMGTGMPGPGGYMTGGKFGDMIRTLADRHQATGTTSYGGPPGGTGLMPGVGPPGGGAPGTPDYSGFFNSPGYQFSLNAGQNAIRRGATASGGLYSTNTLLNLNNYSEGQAATHYNDYVQQLLQMAGLGGAAVAGTGAAATNYGNNASTLALSAGNANASGALGSANAWGNAVNQLGGMNWQKIFSGGSNAGADVGNTGGDAYGSAG